MVTLLVFLTLFGDFGSSRASLKEILASHLLSHPECESREMIEAIDSVGISWEFSCDQNVRAWILDGKIYLNSNKWIKWSDEQIALTLIHEMTHILGKCLNDSIRSHAAPICEAYGRKIYYSEDLSRAIKDHFKGKRKSLFPTS